MAEVKNKSFSMFVAMWFAQFISSIGSGMTTFALGVFVFQKTQTASSFVMIVLCSYLPSIVLRPLGGVLADRFDRRMMMIAGDVGSAFGLLYVIVMMSIGGIQLWQIYLGVTFSSVFTALESPSYNSSVTDLLTEAQYSRASGLIQLASSAQYLVSPILAGFLLPLVSTKGILIVDVSTFSFIVVAVLFIKKSLLVVGAAREKKSFLSDLVDGWKDFVKQRGILILMIVISVITLYMGLLQSLLGPMILSFADAKVLGIVQTIGAMGMLVTSLLIGIFTIKKNYVGIFFLALAFSGLFFSLLGITKNVVAITVVGFLYFCSITLVNTSTDVLVRKNINNEKQGRAWGIIGVISQIGYIVAYITAGFLADRVFNPLLALNGSLAGSIGMITGVGPGRGIAFLFMVSGALVVLLAVTTFRIKPIRELDGA